MFSCNIGFYIRIGIIICHVVVLDEVLIMQQAHVTYASRKTNMCVCALCLGAKFTSQKFKFFLYFNPNLQIQL